MAKVLNIKAAKVTHTYDKMQLFYGVGARRVHIALTPLQPSVPTTTNLAQAWLIHNEPISCNDLVGFQDSNGQRHALPHGIACLLTQPDLRRLGDLCARLHPTMLGADVLP